MAKKKRNQQPQCAWLVLAKEAAVEMDKSERNFEKAERLLLQSLELLAAESSYPKEHRYIDEHMIVSTLAFAYAGQQRIALACMIADYVVENVCRTWPAFADGNLIIWRAILHKMQQLYLACGQEQKALDLAVDRLDKINVLVDMLMEQPKDFPGCEDWVDEVVPQSQSAVLQLRMQKLQTQETFEQVKSMLRAS